jgi:Peptidase propeptide and YPEB domain
MKKLMIVAFAAALCGSPAFADEKPAEDEAGKIKQTISDWGCTGGTFEKESEASGMFEADDVKCKDGNQYDVKLDGSFKVISITRD